MLALILAHGTHSIAGHLSKRFRAIGTLSLQVKQPAALTQNNLLSIQT